MKTKRELARELRKRGLSYDDIAEILEISKRDAYKYAKDVQVLKIASVRAEKTPKKTGKRVSGEDLKKTDSQILAKKTLRRIAELRDCGERSKDKFVYDVSKDFGVKCKEYEKKIPSMRGFIPSAYQHLWNFYFDSFAEIIEEGREIIEEERESNSRLRAEFKTSREMAANATKNSFETIKTLRGLFALFEEFEPLLKRFMFLLRELRESFRENLEK